MVSMAIPSVERMAQRLRANLTPPFDELDPLPLQHIEHPIDCRRMVRGIMAAFFPRPGSSQRQAKR
jgi:hypothetical protein